MNSIKIHSKIRKMNIQLLTNNINLTSEVTQFINKWNDSTTYFTTKTSGSTGQPKEITIQKKHAIASAKATLLYLNLTTNDTALLCLNPETIGGKMMIVRSIVANMPLIIVEPSANPLKELEETVDFIALAPIQLDRILDETPEKLKKIRAIIVGGGIISNETLEKLKNEKITVFQTFGMTETISHIALRKVGFTTNEAYTTVENIEVSEADGQLVIHASSIGHSSLKCNDLVKVVNPHQFIWLGRSDFVINSGGVKIQIESLEKELKNVIKQNFFIHPKKDSALGEKVVLIIEGEENSSYTSKSFFHFLTNKYHIPKEIAFIPQFIRTKSDKINRIANFELINEFKAVL